MESIKKCRSDVVRHRWGETTEVLKEQRIILLYVEKGKKIINYGQDCMYIREYYQPLS